MQYALTVDPQTPTVNVYNGQNRINGVPYDQAGNQQGANGDTLRYDAEGRQIQVYDNSFHTHTTYAYDGNGQRVQKAGPSGTTVYVYDALPHLAGEYASTAAHAPCATCYAGYDHLGSVRLVTDQSGAVVSRHDYLPFGEEIAAGRTSQFGATDNLSPRFTGQERDGESGLDYFGARYYGSALGHYTCLESVKTS